MSRVPLAAAPRDALRAPVPCSSQAAARGELTTSYGQARRLTPGAIVVI
jgi:hypothetical protein